MSKSRIETVDWGVLGGGRDSLFVQGTRIRVVLVKMGTGSRNIGV